MSHNVIRNSSRLAFLLFSALGAGAGVAQQEIRDDELLKRAAFEVQEAAKLEAMLETQRAALTAGAEALKAARSNAAEAPPFPGAASTRPALAAADAAELARAHKVYEDARTKFEAAVRTATSLIDARRAALGTAAETAAALSRAAANARPALDELKRRADAGTIAPDKIKLDEKGLTVDAWIARTQAAAKGADALRASFEGESKTLETEKAEVAARGTLDAETQEARERAGRAAALLLHAVTLEATETEERSKAQATGLVAAIPRLVEEHVRAEEAYTVGLRRSDEAEAALAEADRLVAAPFAAPAEVAPRAGAHAELVEAERSLAAAAALAAFHERRIAAVKAAHEAAAKAHAALRACVDLAEETLGDIAKLRATWLLTEEARAAAAASLPEKPVEVSLDALWERVREISESAGLRGATARRLAARTATPPSTEAAEKEAAASKAEAERLRAVVGEEGTYGSFLAEMAARSVDELIAMLAPEGLLAVAVQARMAAADELDKAAATAEQAARAIREELRGIESPYTVTGLRLSGERAAEIRRELESLQDAALPADHATDPLTTPVAVANPPTPAPSANETEKDVVARQKRVIEDEQTSARELGRYFSDLGRLLVAWKDALRKVDEAGKAAAAGRSEVINEEKRRFASARELERRFQAGNVPRDAMPPDLGKLAARDAVRAAVSRRDEDQRRRDGFRARAERDVKRLDELTTQGKWAVVRTAAADRKAALIGRPVAHYASASAKFSELSEADRKNLVFQSELRRTRDDHWFENVVASFGRPKSRERFEDPLTAYYLEIVQSERVTREFTAAGAAYEELVVTANDERVSLAEAPAALRAEEARRVFDYQAVRHLAAVTGAPDKLAQIAAAFRAKFKTELPVPADVHEWSKRHWADQLLAAEARLWGQRAWLLEIETHLSKVGVEAEIGRYRKQLARVGAEIAVESARRTKIDSDIAELRTAYSEQMRLDAGRTLIELLIFPVVAWLLIRLLRRVAKRIESKPDTGLSPAEIEKLRRLGTLTRVLTTAVATVIWVVTAIFVLGKLGADVTPLIASAGVVGLAVAFGAQALIRDYLSGFFILLENQFRIGDVVDVGGVSGVVERISLRTTVLRDMEGTVHFIPNGTLARVANKTEGWSRAVIEIGIAYGENIDRASTVLRETLAVMHADVPWRIWIIEPPEVVGVEALGESSVRIRVAAKTRPGKQWDTAREIRKRIKVAFDKAGIEIPFPQRVVRHVRDASTEKGPPPTPGTADVAGGADD